MQENIIRTLLINANRDQYLQLAKLLKAVPGTAYEMTWCADYDYALEAMLAPIHDVVLLDYEHAPDICEELLRSANAHGCTAPILCLTAEENPELDRAAIQTGAADYLVKHKLDFSVIERTIRYAIDRKKAEKQLARLAHFDSLTGIPNRLLFEDRLERALQRGERGDLPFALLYIDLDGFKAVNDTHGHDAGDALVVGIASRLRDCIRRTDTVARIGGDEFTLLLEKVSSTNDTVNIAQKVISVISKPFDINGVAISVGASVGIAVYPEAGTDAQTLLRNADMAMYEAKSHSGSNYRFFTEAMNVEVSDQKGLEAQLRTAIGRDELELHYQPRISLRTGKVVGTEALLRWNHPERGLLLPGEFIALAEQVNLIVPLGYWALNHLCINILEMDAKGIPPVRMSLNISHYQFAASDFVTTVKSILDSHTIDPSRLEFELSEPDLMSHLNAIESDMELLSKMGIRFALDDFGTGFSSLPQLQQLPFKTLKLDASHVQQVTESENSADIVRAMIYLAHGLDLMVVAEGVETEEQKLFLAANRCDHLQGFYHSKPLPTEKMIELLSVDGATSVRSYLSVVDH